MSWQAHRMGNANVSLGIMMYPNYTSLPNDYHSTISHSAANNNNNTNTTKTTSFLTLPHELRQKILMHYFGTWTGFLPFYADANVLESWMVEALGRVHPALQDDVIYVAKKWIEK